MSQTSKVSANFGSLVVSGFKISSKQNIQELTAATTLTSSDSGKTFYLNSVTEFTTTLPLVSDASGFKARFVVKSAPSGASYAIASAAANISGSILSPADATGSSARTAGTPVTTITFADTKAVRGDFVEISSDGTNYYVSGSSSTFDGIAFA